MNFLKFYIRLENSETHVKFDHVLDKITLANKAMGLEEFLLDRAEKQGISKKERSFTEALLKETDFSLEKIAHLAGVSVAYVEKVKRERELE